MTVVTRFAPSPTGYLHIGGARTALFSWLYARHHGGKFVLRIEDTDRERSTEESVQAIFEGMQWLGIDWDEGPHYQTQRFDRYKTVIQELLDQGDAYHCYCSREELDAMRAEQMAAGGKPRYDGRCRHRSEPLADVQPVVRFRTPTDGDTVFNDLIRGEITTPNSELDDLIIARSDGTPTYNLTVVVDDCDMGVTEVIRGDDHINNTPRQVNILRAMGAELPNYAHVPMILGDDGKRLSKRHGAVSVTQFRDEGILPEALLNALVRLGWSHGDEEVFSIEEMIEKFSLQAVQKSAAAFDANKLMSLNQHYLKAVPLVKVLKVFKLELVKRGWVDGETDIEALADVQRQRCKTVNEMCDQSRLFFEDFDSYDQKAAAKNFKTGSDDVLLAMQRLFVDLSIWQPEPLHEVIKRVAEERDLKLGKVAQPLRVALAGGPVSPSLDVTLYLLGRKRSLERIERAVSYIQSLQTAGE